MVNPVLCRSRRLQDAVPVGSSTVALLALVLSSAMTSQSKEPSALSAYSLPKRPGSKLVLHAGDDFDFAVTVNIGDTNAARESRFKIFLPQNRPVVVGTDSQP